MNDAQARIGEAQRKLERIQVPQWRKIRLYQTALVLCGLLSCAVLYANTFKGALCLAASLTLTATLYPTIQALSTTLKRTKEALEKEPVTAEDYAARAWALSWSGEEFYDLALEDYHVALEWEPENESFLSGLAAFLWEDLHDGGRALPYVEKLCKIESEDQGDAFVLLGQILTRRDPDAALAAFDRAIELDDVVHNYVERLRFLVETDRRDEATEYAEEVAKRVKQSGGLCRNELRELQGRLADKTTKQRS